MSGEHESVTLFREYLRIKTVQPKPDYAGAVAFFERLASKYGLTFNTIELVPGKPIITLIWQGKDPNLKAILLNSHTDVVPVVPERWSHDPFGAEKDSEGRIYARGAQDMKCVSIQHIEAVAALKKQGFVPTRTIVISLVPDEEIGGKDGMEKWVHTDNFKKLNIGFALDEGLASPTEVCPVYYGERVAWWLKVEASGPTGHGSQLFPQTAVTKLMKFLSHFNKLRDEELAKLGAGGRKLGDVTTININMIKGGMFAPDGSWQTNVVPPTAMAAIDVRISPNMDLKEFDAKIKQWASEADVSVTWLTGHELEHCTTSTDPERNIWWKTFADTMQALNIKVDPSVFPAATDSRFIRRVGIPALGFSPMNNTPVLLHDHDEYLSEDVFLRGIDTFKVLIEKLASVGPQPFDN